MSVWCHFVLLLSTCRWVKPIVFLSLLINVKQWSHLLARCKRNWPGRVALSYYWSCECHFRFFEIVFGLVVQLGQLGRAARHLNFFIMFTVIQYHRFHYCPPKSRLCGRAHTIQGCCAQNYSRWQHSCTVHSFPPKLLHDVTFCRNNNALSDVLILREHQPNV